MALGECWAARRATDPVAMRDSRRTAVGARAAGGAAEGPRVEAARGEATEAAGGLEVGTAGHGAHTLSARPA